MIEADASSDRGVLDRRVGEDYSPPATGRIGEANGPSLDQEKS